MAVVKTLVIAGAHSGVGKTTITVGLIAALRARGLTVQPFKVGPDYIDPSHHTLAAGRLCRNLDSWMMSPERVRALFEHVAADADVALIEGVMGLYDGVGYEDETASTAHIAKLLGAPVVLVIDAAKMARSAGALALGYQRFDPNLNLAGFIVNRIGSAKHGMGVASAITKATGLPMLGCLPRADSVLIPERHLGLVPSAEPGRWSDFVSAAVTWASEGIDLDRLLRLTTDLETRTHFESEAPARAVAAPVIAVARDEAFHFCYEENLTLLRQAGAAIAFFSPIHDARLPESTSGIILSGGFPELFAGALAANTRMHAALRAAHSRRMPIYAECGGLMYLTESIVDFDGQKHPMVGLLPGYSVMTRKLALGYRQARPINASWLFPEEDTVRGHEFHYSEWHERPDSLPAAYEMTSARGDGAPRREGANVNELLASYVHIHFWGKPELAMRVVSACRRGAQLS